MCIAHSSNCLPVWGAVYFSECWDTPPLGVGLETPLHVGLEPPPTDPSTSPWVWAWNHPPDPQPSPPRCGPGDYPWPHPSTPPRVWAWRPPKPDPSTSPLGVGWIPLPPPPPVTHASENITLPQLRCGWQQHIYISITCIISFVPFSVLVYRFSNFKHFIPKHDHNHGNICQLHYIIPKDLFRAFYYPKGHILIFLKKLTSIDLPQKTF